MTCDLRSVPAGSSSGMDFETMIYKSVKARLSIKTFVLAIDRAFGVWPESRANNLNCFSINLLVVQNSSQTLRKRK